MGWRETLAGQGFDQPTACEFYAETTRKLVLLDTGVLPDARRHLADFAGYLGLPSQVLPVGLDYFQTYLSARIQQWELRRLKEKVSQLQERVAGYSTAMDMISSPQSFQLSLERLERMAWKVAKIVQAVQLFTQSAPDLIVNSVNLNEIIQDVQPAILAEMISERDIQQELLLEADLPLISCSRKQISQALLNLIQNALDASPDGSVITIRTHYDAEAQEILLSVVDRGIGIPPKVQDLLFTPFFTTKELGRRVGLGLSAVQGIAQAHGGRVSLDSEAGKGSTFTMHFPTRAVIPTTPTETLPGRYS